MFNSRFLKSTSYAVLSASVASVAHGANGFAQVELGNEQKESEAFNGENILSLSEQKGLKLDDVSSADETNKEFEGKKKIEEGEKKGRRIWPRVVLGIIVLFFLLLFFFLWGVFRCGTKNFRKLSFLEKIELVEEVNNEINLLRNLVFPDERKAQLERIESRYRQYFVLEKLYSLYGLDSKLLKAEQECEVKGRVIKRGKRKIDRKGKNQDFIFLSKEG